MKFTIEESTVPIDSLKHGAVYLNDTSEVFMLVDVGAETGLQGVRLQDGKLIVFEGNTPVTPYPRTELVLKR
jgi:hypothetical protein